MIENYILQQTPNYLQIILNIFFMKKLIIVMSCFTAVILMSSCTTDSIDDIKKENSINSQEVPTTNASTGTPTNPPVETDTTTGVDDRDKSKG
jgi:hypothetical protein